MQCPAEGPASTRGRAVPALPGQPVVTAMPCVLQAGTAICWHTTRPCPFPATAHCQQSWDGAGGTNKRTSSAFISTFTTNRSVAPQPHRQAPAFCRAPTPRCWEGRSSLYWQQSVNRMTVPTESQGSTSPVLPARPADRHKGGAILMLLHTGVQGLRPLTGTGGLSLVPYC